MSQIIARVYTRAEDADAAVAELRRHRVFTGRVRVVAPPSAPDAPEETVEGIVTAVLRTPPEDRAARRFAQAVREGATLVAVDPLWSTTQDAIEILDGFSPMDVTLPEPAPAPFVWDGPTPLSDTFGIPVLCGGPAPLSRFLNLPVLTRGRASLSQALGLRELSRRPFPLSGSLGLPMLSRSASPLSDLFKLPVLTRRRASDPRRMPLLRNNPAPFSKLLGLPVLTRDPTPLSSAVNAPVLTRDPAPLSNAVNAPVLTEK